MLSLKSIQFRSQSVRAVRLGEFRVSCVTSTTHVPGKSGVDRLRWGKKIKVSLLLDKKGGDVRGEEEEKGEKAVLKDRQSE